MNIQQIAARFSFCVLAGCTFAAAPTFAQTITHVPLTFEGDSVTGEISAPVSDAGDVNGDGFDDVIVRVFDGARVVARVLSGFDSGVLYNFSGDPPSNSFGSSLSGAGDVNGDGFDDLIFGNIGRGENFGGARVRSGSDGSVLYDFDGDSFFGFFGSSVSGAGDVNGDGFDDLIVGAPLDNSNGSFSGRAQVFSGVDGTVLHIFDGESDGDRFGWTVSGAGDVNGDGFDDLIIGSTFVDNNGNNSGSARVHSGLDGAVLYNFDGDSASDRFGDSVSGAGDVNGDGFDDLIVGASRDDNTGFSSGSARVFSGLDGSVLYNFDGDSAGDFFGESVSGVGDVNGDGFDDLIVGASNDDNNGSNSGSARVLSGSDGSVLYTFDGDSAGDLFGLSVSGAGDVNGDGVADFIVGAQDGGANDNGYARLFVSQITAPILGDCNQDGVVDFLDINPFISILSDNTFLEQADCNQDGVVNFLDIAPFIDILTGN